MHLPDDCGCKVDYVSQKHDLDRLEERVRRRRVSEDYSLRDLETYINGRILRAAMIRADMAALEGQAEDYYQRLTEEDEESLRRKEVRRHLIDAGVDVDDVADDFVSYQTVRKHLNECLDVDTSQEYIPDPNEDRQRLGDLKGRAENVIERTIRRLRKHGAVHIGPPEGVVQLQVRCRTCGRTHSVSEILRERECACAGNTNVKADASTSNDATEPRNTPR